MLKETPDGSGELKFFALLSDVHANIDALEAVMADLAGRSLRGIVCLGDVVGYGADPGACVRAVMERCEAVVVGNHETIFRHLEMFPDEELPPTIGAPLEVALAQLGEAEKQWVKELPLVMKSGVMTWSHSSLDNPGDFHYILGRPEARAHFARQETAVSFQGHTHVPVIWECDAAGKIRVFQPTESPVRLDPACRYAINVGSVGQPRDGDARACYVLFDPERFVVQFCRVAYDIKRAQERIRTAGLPKRNAERLREGR